MKVQNLKLIARTTEDLRVISAHLQDSIVKTSDIANLKKNRRIRTVLKFENILKVASKNVDQKKNDRFLDFLAIETTKMPDKNYEMNLIFSEDIVLKLVAEAIEVTLDDQGSPWDSKNKPEHKDL